MKDGDVLIGVCGGVAAFKAAALVSQLVQAGRPVTVMMSRAATRFVGPATFAALTGRPVVTRMFRSRAFPRGEHIELAERAKIMCVVPATANFLGQAANGLATDLLSTTYLCFRGPVIIAPAMNPDMWQHPAVARNVEQLKQDGVLMIPPADGWVACRRRGPGRLPEPDRIFDEIEAQLADL